MAANRHAVPDAVSQFHAKTAAYGAGAGVTGGTRVIRLCRPGTLMPLRAVACDRKAGKKRSLNLSSAALTDGSPPASTKTTSSKYGIQAMTISLALCCTGAASIGLSSG